MQTSDRTQTVKALSRLFNGKVLTAANCVHIAVDVQKACVSNKETEAADNIVINIAPSFHAAGIHTCWVYITDPHLTYRKTRPCKSCELPTGYEQLYRMTSLPPGDWTQYKNSTSAFRGTDLDATLRGMNKQILFVTGFALAAINAL